MNKTESEIGTMIVVLLDKYSILAEMQSTTPHLLRLPARAVTYDYNEIESLDVQLLMLVFTTAYQLSVLYQTVRVLLYPLMVCIVASSPGGYVVHCTSFYSQTASSTRIVIKTTSIRPMFFIHYVDQAAQHFKVFCLAHSTG